MDFNDCRSMKVVFISNCHLNQNARLINCAESPAAVDTLISGLMEREIGVIQMPCPELMALGLDRNHKPVRPGLEKEEGRQCLSEIGRSIAYQVKQYQDNGVTVLGILGKDGSPSCGVVRTSNSDGNGSIDGQGVYIQELKIALENADCLVPIIGTIDDDAESALREVDKLI